VNTIEEAQVIINWLDAQPDWTEAEMMLPDFCREELRDQEMLDRECRSYREYMERYASWFEKRRGKAA
jgi:hypothetical protein